MWRWYVLVIQNDAGNRTNEEDTECYRDVNLTLCKDNDDEDGRVGLQT